MKINNQKAHYVVNSVYAYAYALDKCLKDNDTSCELSTKSLSDNVKNEIRKYPSPMIVISKYRIKSDGMTGYEQIGECNSNASSLLSSLPGW